MIKLICIDDASLNAWRQDDLTSAVAILSREMEGADHHRLANLAVVRARLKQWDLAEHDARTSIQARSTILAHIAVSIALGGQGKLDSAKREFNRVFLHREPGSECLLLLIKSIIVFVAGDRDEALRRVMDLVGACAEVDKALCRAVQAQMQFLVGQNALNEQDYETALKSFASAGASGPFSNFPELETISLMFGWNFNLLLLVIRQQTCEALYAASRIGEAAESLRTMLNEFGVQMKASAKLSNWLENFTRNCTKALEATADTAVAAGKHNEAIVDYSMALSLYPVSDSLNKTVESLRSKIAHTEQLLRTQHADPQQGADNLVLQAQKQKDRCEALYAEGRIIDAAASLLEMTNTVSEEVRTNRPMMEWLDEFKSKCISTLEVVGDAASSAEKQDEAVAAYSTALLLGPSTSNNLLAKWARAALNRSSPNEALSAAAQFKLPSFVIHRAICDVLEESGRVPEAIRCFQQLQSELRGAPGGRDEQAEWELDFRQRCLGKLEKSGDTAVDSRDYDAAINRYSDALILDPTNPSNILLKRSKARALMGSWEEALIDSDKVIELDPSSYQGYERKHAALQGMERYSEAFAAFQAMLSKLEQSPDPRIRGEQFRPRHAKQHVDFVSFIELRGRYIDATPAIREVINQTIRHMPRVLIDTTTGRLYDKIQQAAAFEELPIYDKLRSSMTTRLDRAHIERTVKTFYRYVMLSHLWEAGEPMFQMVMYMSVYELALSSPNAKLQTFCKLVRSLGFWWAWSDTCCIDKANNVVLQEALVAMFTWFHESSLTIVHLRGVLSESEQLGGLQRSIWNTRAWTYQEYIASKAIQFYTEDWKPYLGLDIFNHKQSPVILAEMEQAMNFATRDLVALRPGLDRVREKLYLASMRHTTVVEDFAYSLLGIFNVSIPVIYGEGNRAIGRLLEQVLTGSGDVTILAWTGRPGDYNSCLPVDLTVYSPLVPPHIPPPMETNEMDSIITALHSSLPDLSLAVTLYERLNQLPSPSLTASRLRLPGIVFRLTQLVHASGPDPVSNVHVYHAKTSTFGDVEIGTTDNLTGTKDLLLIHPWIGPLLDQEHSDGAAALDRTTQALRFIARLRQPFGALLFKPLSRVDFRRVAMDALIMVQIRDEVSLTELIDNVRTIEVR